MPFLRGLVEVSTSSTQGRGIFAKVDIPAKTVYWRFRVQEHEAADEWENLGDGANHSYSEEEVRELESDPQALKRVLWGGYLHDPTQLSHTPNTLARVWLRYAGVARTETWRVLNLLPVIPLPVSLTLSISSSLPCHTRTPRRLIDLRDGAQFTNHSTSPTCGGDWTADPADEYSVTIRDVRAGEELFDDYGVFRETQSPWLKDMFQKHCPERHDFEEKCVHGRAIVRHMCMRMWYIVSDLCQ